MQTISNSWCSLADLDPFQPLTLDMRNALVEANGTARNADCGFTWPLSLLCIVADDTEGSTSVSEYDGAHADAAQEHLNQAIREGK